MRHVGAASVLVAMLSLAGCASRPVNPPLAAFDPTTGYRVDTANLRAGADPTTIMALAPRHRRGRSLERAARSGHGACTGLRSSRASAGELKLYAIDLSFDAIADAAERDYFMGLPTSFALPPEAIDRLRAVAGKLLRDSPAYRELLRDLGGTRPR